MFRALRLDKLIYRPSKQLCGIVTGTLGQIPVLRMISQSSAELRARRRAHDRLARRHQATVVERKLAERWADLPRAASPKLDDRSTMQRRRKTEERCAGAILQWWRGSKTANCCSI